MRRLLKWLVWSVAAILLALIAFVGYVYAASGRQMSKIYTVTGPKITVPTDPVSLARGKYLVEKVAGCAECHGADLGGQVMINNFAMGYLAAANLTRGRGGIGARYSDEDYVRALAHGVRPDGRTVIFMPSADFHFTEGALGSIIAYVKSVPPVDRELARPSPGPMARALSLFADFPLMPASRIDHEHVTLASPKDQTNPVAAGEEMVAIAGCRGCHGPELAGGSGPPPGAANITPVGIGPWTEQDFLTALREHRRPNGTKIDDAMPRAYGEMASADLHNIYSYLKTLTPKGEKSKNQQ